MAGIPWRAPRRRSRTRVGSGDPHARPSNWLVRDFVVGHRESHLFLDPGDPDAQPPEVERPTVVLPGTADDDRTAWLQAGRALGRLLLRATAEGVAASPLTQALDWPATRTQMRSRLSWWGIPRCCCAWATRRRRRPAR